MKALRLVLTFATALCAWLWVGVAEAHTLEAPRCDGRGATTFAEAPTMQPLLRSLQVLSPDDDGCIQEEASDVCGSDRAPAPAPDQSSVDPMLPSGVAIVVALPLESGLLGIAPRTLSFAPAHAGSLERPPRS